MSFWTDITFREPLRQNRWYLVFGDSQHINEEEKSTFKNHNLNGQKYALKTCTKPSLSLEVMEALHFNTFKYFPRTYKWKPITITMVSGLGNRGTTTAAKALYEMFFGIQKISSDNSAMTFKKYGAQSIKQLFNNNVKIDEDDKTNNIPSDASKEQILQWLKENEDKIENNDIDMEQIFCSMPNMVIHQTNPEGKVIEEWFLHAPIITDINWGQLSYESDNFVDIEFKIQYWAASLTTFNQYDSVYDAQKDEADRKKIQEEKQKEINQKIISDVRGVLTNNSALIEVQKPFARQQAEAKEKNIQQAKDIVAQSGIKQTVTKIQTENEFQDRFNPQSPFAKPTTDDIREAELAYNKKINNK